MAEENFDEKFNTEVEDRVSKIARDCHGEIGDDLF